MYLKHETGSGPLRILTRLTFDAGVQFGPTWSPDGRFIAYSADRGGKFDIWVQQVGAVTPVKITAHPGS
jgi:Tol biopolymer transport system component